MGMTNSGTPPLQAVKDYVISFDVRLSLDVRGIGGSYVGFRHAKSGANFTRQQRPEPAFLLRIRTVLHQHFHVASVGSIAVENLGSNRGAPRNLRQRR